MKASGWGRRDMARGSRSGRMDRFMKEIGRMIRLMGMAGCTTRMGIPMKECGRMIKLTATEYIHMLTAQSITESGKMINNMGLAKRNGLITLFIKACTQRARKTGKENWFLETVPCTKENSR